MHYRVLKSIQKTVLNRFKNPKQHLKNNKNFKNMLKHVINFCDSQIVYMHFEQLLRSVTVKSLCFRAIQVVKK